MSAPILLRMTTRPHRISLEGFGDIVARQAVAIAIVAGDPLIELPIRDMAAFLKGNGYRYVLGTRGEWRS